MHAGSARNHCELDAMTVITVWFAAYVGAVNAGSAGLFFYDKECAKARQWRVPEATLCMTALAGGWLGGM